MAGGFIAFRCTNFENTAEREQFRLLCNILMEKYKNTNDFCLLIANYNIYDSEFDSILIKNDAIIAIEFKNYGGKIIATENGEWTSDGNIIKGGSRKTVYQQARVNHAALRNGLRELGINAEWIKNIPSLVVFNQDVELDNQLSSRVKTWLHITDNKHFLEKVEDITSKSTDISNTDIIDIAIKMNLSNFIDHSLSHYQIEDSSTETKLEEDLTSTADIAQILSNYDRRTPNHIFNLRENQIFVFGTDTKGSQKYGAAGIAAKKFGAQVGVVEGPTGNCYALPTRGFTISDLSKAVERLLHYIDNNPNHIYLITPVGCGHAGFDAEQVAILFKKLITYENVMLPELFLKVYESETSNTSNAEDTKPLLVTNNEAESEITDNNSRIVSYFEKYHIPYDLSKGYELRDKDGNVIAKAEFGIEIEKIVLCPYNIQSEATFRNYGYRIIEPEEFIKSHNI